VFFLNLNKYIKDEPILKMFWKEKRELVGLGKKIIEDLDREIEHLKGDREREPFF